MALGLIATGSALGQTLVCTERLTPEGANWYHNIIFPVGGKNLLAFNQAYRAQNLAYEIVCYDLSATGESFAGTGEFTFPAQKDGVEVQVHYQLEGDNWTVGTTAKTASGQVAKCPFMFVPKGGSVAFVVRVAVADSVPDGTPINVSLLKVSGLAGVSTGLRPAVQINTKTGPWAMKWWNKPILRLESGRSLPVQVTVTSPPWIWAFGNWRLEGTQDLKSWATVRTVAVVPENWDKKYIDRSLVVMESSRHHQFYRLVVDE